MHEWRAQKADSERRVAHVTPPICAHRSCQAWQRTASGLLAHLAAVVPEGRRAARLSSAALQLRLRLPWLDRKGPVGFCLRWHLPERHLDEPLPAADPVIAGRVAASLSTIVALEGLEGGF